MSKLVRGIKVSIDQIINSEAPNAAARDYVTPKKATVLSTNYGTLIEAEEGGLYVVPVGEWFRSVYFGRAIPQVDQFNQLQDYGLTQIKDKLVRHEEPKIEEKVEVKKSEKPNGQEISSQNNVSPKKIDKAVASNPKSEKKD